VEVNNLKIKESIIGIILLSMIIISGCTNRTVATTIPRGDSKFNETSDFSDYSQQERMLAKFVSKKMISSKGIYTNYTDEPYTKGEARGHELLSESAGLWLEYLAYTHQYNEFKNFYQKIKGTFNQGSQFSYRYTPIGNKKSSVNATLDDLRIIRALQMYAELTGDKVYKSEAAERFANLKKNTMSNGKIANFYDTNSHRTSSDGSLSYYDFSTLKFFESVSESSKRMYRKQLEVVQNGYLGDAFPLYAASYNWQSKTYSNNDLNTSEALETILHLTEIGKVKQATINWLERQVMDKTLYNTYSVNGSVTKEEQSAGSYAIAAMIFANRNNQVMYREAMDMVWRYQITKKDSPIYGSIGIEKNNQAYSFNNLTALIATKY